MITKKIVLQESSELLYPSHIKCVSCDKELFRKSAHDLCDECIPEYNRFYCPICGRNTHYYDMVCRECSGEQNAFDKARSSMVYGKVAATLVKRFKYGHAKYLAPIIADFMIRTFEAMREDGTEIITYVPMHPKKQRERGYNQSEELAKIIADSMELTLLPLLVKTKQTRSQASTSSAATRSINIDKSIDFNEQYRDVIKGKSVLLIDDVLTTGTTCNVCARKLKDGGANEVFVLTFASVPYKQSKKT